MARARTIFACQSCGHASPKWLGRCPSCDAWNTFVEEIVRPEPSSGTGRAPSLRAAKPVPLASVTGGDAPRARTGVEELDRVLGGGLVAGSLVLVGGEPGVGKSTLALQAALRMSAAGAHVLYVTGEETALQVRLRADRLGAAAEGLHVLAEGDLSAILEHARRPAPALLVVDSVQTVYLPDIPSGPGSVGQVRECGAALMLYAKTTGVPTLLVGHVTKEGTLAGPRVLEHLVDTVLYFEGERHHAFRVLRAVKNRFGSASELGIFEMRGDGLFPVADPSRVLLAERPRGASGSAVAAAMEGSRPLLIEVQALVSPTRFGYPQRQVSGLDSQRCAMLLAVVDRRAGFPLADRDVFLSVAGGIEARDPDVDLAVAVATASSCSDSPVDPGTVLFGEVGLSGELRAVPGVASRLREAAQLGFSRAVVPASSARDAGGENGDAAIEIVPASSLAEALAACGIARPRRARASGD